jgi:glycosyltransferase A (GT-A) superfamily protein (DUF2064 family)/SAM-dependent methyltransferase
MSTLIVIAKAPVPGRVKTRLCPPFTPRQAAELAEAALRDTLCAVVRARADQRLLVLDGEPGAWLPPGFTVVPQVAGTLDLRLAAAFAAAARTDPGPAVLIGMDTPQADPETLTGALRAMAGPAGSARSDAVFGPAQDGGFWLLGLREPGHARSGALLTGVPMSRPDTGELQYGRLIAAGLRTGLVPAQRDVDTAADARAVADLAPGGAFAARLRLIGQAGDPDPPSASSAWLGPQTSGYERALWHSLSHTTQPLDLHGREDGAVVRLDIAKYVAHPDAVDGAVLDRCTGPTLDIGCGPGRLAAELARRGVPSLGVDVTPVALLLARAAGASVLQRSVFDRLPGEGRWPHALLMDGNIGIGGDPRALLGRIKALLKPDGGELIVEAAACDEDERLRLHMPGRAAPIPWARLGVPALRAAAEPLGYRLAEQWNSAGRRFAVLAT